MTASGVAGGGDVDSAGAVDSAGEVNPAMQPQTSNTTRSVRLLSICSMRRLRNSSGGDRPATPFRTSPIRTSETSIKVCRRCLITSLRARANKRHDAKKHEGETHHEIASTGHGTIPFLVAAPHGCTRRVRLSGRLIDFTVAASGSATESRTIAATRSAYRTVPRRTDRADPGGRNLSGANRGG